MRIILADGQVQVVISLQVTPFASMGATARGEVDVPAATSAASSWAANTSRQLATQLGLAPSDPCAPSIQTAWIFGSASVRVCATHAPQAAEWLLVQPSVVWVDVRKGVSTLDYHSNIMMQNSTLRSALSGEFLNVHATIMARFLCCIPHTM